VVHHWTAEEKAKFVEAFKKHGRDWKVLSSSVPGKSVTQIRSFYQNYKRRLELDKYDPDPPSKKRKTQDPKAQSGQKQATKPSPPSGAKGKGESTSAEKPKATAQQAAAAEPEKEAKDGATDEHAGAATEAKEVEDGGPLGKKAPGKTTPKPGAEKTGEPPPKSPAKGTKTSAKQVGKPKKEMPPPLAKGAEGKAKKVELPQEAKDASPSGKAEKSAAAAAETKEAATPQATEVPKPGLSGARARTTASDKRGSDSRAPSQTGLPAQAEPQPMAVDEQDTAAQETVAQAPVQHRPQSSLHSAIDTGMHVARSSVLAELDECEDSMISQGGHEHTSRAAAESRLKQGKPSSLGSLPRPPPSVGGGTPAGQPKKPEGSEGPGKGTVAGEEAVPGRSVVQSDRGGTVDADDVENPGVAAVSSGANAAKPAAKPEEAAPAAVSTKVQAAMSSVEPGDMAMTDPAVDEDAGPSR